MKHTFYFSHDYSARQDIKIKELLYKHGCLGYGIYWCIIEDLYTNNNQLHFHPGMLSFEYRCDKDVVQSIITDFDLFVVDKENGTFSSKSVQNRLEVRGEKSKKGRENAQKRWGEDPKRLKANGTIFYIARLFNDAEEFIKCGVTSESVSKRLSNINEYSNEVLFSADMNNDLALEIERGVSEKYPSYMPKMQFGGYLECYDLSFAMQIKDFAMAKLCEPNALKERKGKERKDSINININTLSNSEFDNSSDSSKNDIQKDKDFELLKDFDKFRKKYPGTKRGAEIEFENLKKKHKKDYRDIILILEKELDRQFEERTKRLQAKIFTPEWKNLQTYINNRSWEETFPIQEQSTNKNLEPEQSVVKRATGEVRFGGPKK